MTLFKFLDTVFTNTSITIQTDYTPKRDGTLKGISAIISFQRWFFKWTSIPVVVTKYYLTKIGLLSVPVSLLPKKVAASTSAQGQMKTNEKVLSN